jgi:4'-phosphopantetheinyl transferase
MIEISHDEVHVWHTSLVVSDDELEHHNTLLSPDERRYAERFTNDSTKLQFVVGRAKLRELLGRYANQHPHDLRFGITREGKPFLASAREFEFNLTHSGEIVIYGVGRSRPVGVDVEHIKPIPRALELSKRYMAPEEHELVASASPDERDRTFLSLWVKREGSGKAYGVGIWKVLEHNGARNKLFGDILREYSHHVIDYETEYVAAIAALGSDWKLVRRGAVGG